MKSAHSAAAAATYAKFIEGTLVTCVFLIAVPKCRKCVFTVYECALNDHVKLC